MFHPDGTLGIYQYTGVVWVNLSNGHVPDANGSTLPANGGVATTLAGLAGNQGSTNGTGTAARSNGPSNLAVDAAGTVYVADQGNQLIRVIR